jgi:large subunit ribosomal protein L9
LAVVASDAAMCELEKNKSRIEKKELAKKEDMKKLAVKLSSKPIEIKADAGEGGKLFGSVTSSDLSAGIKKTLGIEIDKKKIEIEEPIKVLGSHKVRVKLYHDVDASISVQVSAS